MLNLVKCFRPNAVLNTKFLFFLNPYLQSFKYNEKLFTVNTNYIYVPKPYRINYELKLKLAFFSGCSLIKMPKKSRKNKARKLQRRQDDTNIPHFVRKVPLFLKRKPLTRVCKASATFDEDHGLSPVKKSRKIVEEPDISSASSDELCVLYDHQEEKKKKVYELITVASDDESNAECSKEPCSITKVPNNPEQSDDEIEFLGIFPKSLNKDSIKDSVSKLEFGTLKKTDCKYTLNVDLPDNNFANTTLNCETEFKDIVSKSSDRLINKIPLQCGKVIEEVFLSSSSDSCDLQPLINLNSFKRNGKSGQSFSSNFVCNSELSEESLKSDIKPEIEDSHLELKDKNEISDMDYCVILNSKDDLPIKHKFVSTFTSLSTNDIEDVDSDDCSRSPKRVKLFDNDDSNSSYGDNTILFPRWSEASASGRCLDIRDEEFTNLGRKYEKGEIKEDSENLIFKVMSYNMLSQQLLENHKRLYQRCNFKTLKWEFRWKLLLKEITDLKPDILCMQEVESRHLRNYYSQLLELGYHYIYKKRTGLQIDGCAIYFNPEKFILDIYSPVEYNHKVPCLDRDNIGIVAKFLVRKSSKDAIVVATTHLLYNPRRCDVRLAQMQLLFAEIDKLAYNPETKMYYPVILTGDLNETPKGSVYHFIKEGELTYQGRSFRNLMTTADDSTRMTRVLIPNWLGVTDSSQYVEILKSRKSFEGSNKLAEENETDERFSTGTLTHNFKFTSVYTNIKNDGNLEASTEHDSWITVDYIFYSLHKNKKTKKNKKGNLKLLSKIRLPTQNECMIYIKHLPNELIGSDHLSLAAKFLLQLKVKPEANNSTSKITGSISEN